MCIYIYIYTHTYYVMCIFCTYETLALVGRAACLGFGISGFYGARGIWAIWRLSSFRGVWSLGTGHLTAFMTASILG